MRKKRKRTAVSQNNSYWKSYSDMMAALLLMFILIMTLALAKAESAITEAQRNANEIKKKETEIEQLLGIKPQIVKELKEQLSEFEVDIDENTGDIMFKSDILFDYNKYDLKSDGANFLGRFIPKYMSVILNEKYLPSIAEIIIEGHTDMTGSYEFNLKLSQARAMSVAQYIVGEKSNFLSASQKSYVRKIITVSGKSSTNPVYTDSSKKTISPEKSRRVEIKFRLKNDETIQQLEELLGTVKQNN